MEDKKQLSINLVAQLFAFTVGFIISFFLTPFVVRKLGTEAYGFIGLANNFVSYTTLITIALNSMAARFVSISFHKGDIETAKRYFVSVYYSNLFLSAVIVIFAVFIIGFLDMIVHIPIELERDVKLLFGLTFLNSIIALISNIYLVATFVTNRLDLSSFRNIISNILRGVCIISSFLLFIPHLWYYGVSALVATVFIAITNQVLTKKLLPEFKIDKSLYNFKLVKELVFSGGWNLLTKLSAILSDGLNLLLANLFISMTAMGILSISNAVPVIILSFCNSIASVFAPKLTEFYAKNKIKVLQNELLNNIRIMGILSAIPLVAFIILGEDFFRLWIPAQDAHKLYRLSSIVVFTRLISMPQESLWNIFTIANKVKISSLFILFFSILIFITTLVGIYYFDNEYHKLLSIVVSRFVWGALMTLLFLPVYGAKCLNLKWSIFYPLILKTILLSVTMIVCCCGVRKYFSIVNWLDLCLLTTFICLVTAIFMSLFLLNKYQKIKLINSIKQQFNRRIN
jgi:O-antigen/teichoic acid export membrane protein